MTGPGGLKMRIQQIIAVVARNLKNVVAVRELIDVVAEREHFNLHLCTAHVSSGGYSSSSYRPASSMPEFMSWQRETDTATTARGVGHFAERLADLLGKRCKPTLDRQGLAPADSGARGLQRERQNALAQQDR